MHCSIHTSTDPCKFTFCFSQLQKMVWLLRSRFRWIVSTTAGLGPSSTYASYLWSLPSFVTTNSLAAFSKGQDLGTTKNARITELEFGAPTSETRQICTRSEALRDSCRPSQALENSKANNVNVTEHRQNFFCEMKRRFLSFKKRKFLNDSKYFESLAEAQSPKFMVIACADSRVCPSNILGFQPGEAFMIRNVANLVPAADKGPSETNAALEFAVNVLGVENILVIGHSACGGIQALMTMQDELDASNYISHWVFNSKAAKFRTKATAAHLSFEQQCRNCEKESINRSLLNLLTYPWIENRVRKNLLSIHGGYYDFLNCTFEKWTLDLKGSSNPEGERYLIKDQAFWT